MDDGKSTLIERLAHDADAVYFTGISSPPFAQSSAKSFAGIDFSLVPGDPLVDLNRPPASMATRRFGFIAELLTRNGLIVLVAAISPYRQVRDEIHSGIRTLVALRSWIMIEAYSTDSGPRFQPEEPRGW